MTGVARPEAIYPRKSMRASLRVKPSLIQVHFAKETSLYNVNADLTHRQIYH